MKLAPTTTEFRLKLLSRVEDKNHALDQTDAHRFLNGQKPSFWVNISSDRRWFFYFSERRD